MVPPPGTPRAPTPKAPPPRATPPQATPPLGIPWVPPPEAAPARAVPSPFSGKRSHSCVQPAGQLPWHRPGGRHELSGGQLPQLLHRCHFHRQCLLQGLHGHHLNRWHLLPGQSSSGCSSSRHSTSASSRGSSSSGCSSFFGGSAPCRISPPPNTQVYKCSGLPCISYSRCFGSRNVRYAGNECLYAALFATFLMYLCRPELWK